MNEGVLWLYTYVNTLLKCSKNSLGLTSVCTINFLQNLIFRIQLYTSVTLSRFMRCISLSMAINVPVRPTPALTDTQLCTACILVKVFSLPTMN